MEIDGFLELACFFNDPADVGNLIKNYYLEDFFFFFLVMGRY